jgi:hypothetical protein
MDTCEPTVSLWLGFLISILQKTKAEPFALPLFISCRRTSFLNVVLTFLFPHSTSQKKINKKIKTI